MDGTELLQYNVLKEFDFDLLNSSGFKEDSVREEITAPLLRALGFSLKKPNMIHRSVTLKDPYLMTGSKKLPLSYVPDYVLEAAGAYRWVLDAKAPDEDVLDQNHIGQVYSHARHHEIRVKRYAICNGRQLAIFSDDHKDPLLVVGLQELAHHWPAITLLLSPAAFESEPVLGQPTLIVTPGTTSFDYSTATPPRSITNFKKQSAKRHHGIHGYFTKQVFSVVQAYIRAFTKPGDVVFDPFGGGGVTPIEAVMTDRVGIHLDLNPLSVFMVRTLACPIRRDVFADAYDSIVKAFEKNRPHSPSDCENILGKCWYPKEVPLPPTSDVEFLHQIYSQQQLAELALLRHLIMGVKDENSRLCLLLMFSSTLNKINLTYHASGERSDGRGDSAVFRYYRYRMAPRHSPQDTLTVFQGKLKRLLSAKGEISSKLKPGEEYKLSVLQGTATAVALPDESVDYIYTDPPYGAKINYLDLSVMWNAWLQFPVSDEDMEQEIIEGGSKQKTIEDYRRLMTQSMQEMYRVLKFERWMSFVFAHKDPRYWHLIIAAAEGAGFEYQNVVRQNNGQSSFKKRQKPFKVLQGQLIINFRKVRSPKALATAALGPDTARIVRETIEEAIATNHGATLDEINDALVIRGLEQGFLHVLSKEFADVTPFVIENFDFDPTRKVYLIRASRKLGGHIDLEVRAEYYVVSYLRAQNRDNIDPTFDEIVLNVMPLLRNGTTPDDQTFGKILEKVAVQVGVGRFKLKPDSGQIVLDLK